MITAADRESYAITSIRFVDSDIADSAKMKIFVYVNGEFDSSLSKSDPATTIFLYSKDIVVFDVHAMAEKAGDIEVHMEELFLEHKQAGSPFQKWLGCQHGNILLQFKIQEIQSQQSESQRQSVVSFSGNEHEIGGLGHFNLTNEQNVKNKNNLLIQKDPTAFSILEPTNKKNNKQLLDVSPGKSAAFKVVARGGYQFQKLHSPIKSTKETSSIAQAKPSQSQQPTTPNKQKSEEINENSVTYNQLEEHLAEISRKIVCKSFNAVVEKKRTKYIELKNLLTQIQKYYTQLTMHPCRSCEKKYIPLIINGLNTLNQQYNQLKQSIELQHQQDSIQLPAGAVNGSSTTTTPTKTVHSQKYFQSGNKTSLILGASTGKTSNGFSNSSCKNKNGFSNTNNSGRKSAISPISTPKKNLEKSKNPRLSLSKSPLRAGSSVGNNKIRSSASKGIQQYGEEVEGEEDFKNPQTKTKEAELKLEEEKADNLEKNAEFVREQLEIQFKRTNELEGENRKLRLKNFIIEADLKNLIKRMSLDKLTFTARASFKMNEFREIFEFYHALRLEHSNLINEVESLKNELGIAESDSSEQQQNMDNNKFGKSTGSKMNSGQKNGQNSKYNLSNDHQRFEDLAVTKDTNFRGSSEKKQRSSISDIQELLSQRKNVYAELMEKLHEN